MRLPDIIEVTLKATKEEFYVDSEMILSAIQKQQQAFSRQRVPGRVMESADKFINTSLSHSINPSALGRVLLQSYQNVTSARLRGASF